MSGSDRAKIFLTDKNYMNKKLTLLLCLLLAFAAFTCNAQNQPVKQGNENKNADFSEQPPEPDSKYKAGQMWSYKTRESEKDSYFIVLKVDADPKLGNIIHIAVQNLKIKNPESPDGFSSQVNHLPFAEKSIDQSAVKLLKEKVELPDYEEGYNEWKKNFDSKNAGIFTITIAKAVEAMETGINKGKPAN